MEKNDKKKDKPKPSRIAKITSPKPVAKPKKSSAPSSAMSTWAKANRKMIEKSGTKKQRAILAQVDKGKTKGIGPVKSGAEYARSLNKGKSTPLPKSARNTPKAKPAATAKPKASTQSNKDGTYGKSLPSNPKLKSNTNRRHSLMTKGAMVGEDVKPKKRPTRKSRYSGGTSSTSRTAGGRALNRFQRRRRRP